MTPRPRLATSLLAAAALAVAAASCGGDAAAPGTTQAGEFTGQQRDVANAVEDFAEAARKQDTEQICADLLAAAVVDRLGGGRCADELKGSLRDTNAGDLTIPPRGVTISGDEATVRVVTDLGENDATDTLRLVRERGRWRIAEVGAPAS
jgi:hypothetical protein